MTYTTFTVRGTDYKLALSTSSLIQLEKKIGVNPLMIFGAEGDTIPPFTTIINILFYSSLKFNHGLKYEDMMKLIDDYCEDGGSMTDLIALVLEVYKVSGLIKNQNAEQDIIEKN